ncbi:hypothetical protein B296_00012589 [Ensete ventricosum]|uniref:Uncharacterized protein n=1 Tax=Ensete ventricosum TaxID=4639 RepID=A0A426ZK58_ENSVE|nr:hypothetical protein B296_00012589 [Ensete ventricosum]
MGAGEGYKRNERLELASLLKARERERGDRRRRRVTGRGKTEFDDPTELCMYGFIFCCAGGSMEACPVFFVIGWRNCFTSGDVLPDHASLQGWRMATGPEKAGVREQASCVGAATRI